MKYERLGDIIEISKGKKHNIVENPSFKHKRVIGINDLRNDDNINFTDDKNGVEVDEKDILLAWDGANAGTIGYGKRGYIGSTISRLRIKEGKKYCEIFLGKLLQSKFDYLQSTSTGATIPHISRAALESINVPEFEFDDQIRIAMVLTRAEKLIAKRKHSIKALEKFLMSTFLEMFGPSSIEYSKWPVVEIKDLAASHKGSMRTGPFGSNLLHSEFAESGDVAVLGIDNAVQNKFTWDQRRYITMEKYSELKAYRIFPGDVIVTIMGTVGRSAVIPDDIPLAINTKHLAAITLDRKKANPVFLSYSIHSSPYIINQFASKNRGAIMNGLNLGLIKETKLRKPPIELQDLFADITEQVETLKNKYTQNLIEMESLYGSLSQRAFKGELDLSRIIVPVDHEIRPNDIPSTNAFGDFAVKLGSAPILSEHTKTIIETFNESMKMNGSVYQNLSEQLQVSLMKFSKTAELIESVNRSLIPPNLEHLIATLNKTANFIKPINTIADMSGFARVLQEPLLQMPKQMTEYVKTANKINEVMRSPFMQDILTKSTNEIEPWSEEELCALIKSEFKDKFFVIEDVLELTTVQYEVVEDSELYQTIQLADGTLIGMKEIFINALNATDDSMLKLRQVYEEYNDDRSKSKYKRVVFEVVS